MKLEQRIAIELATSKVITASESATKAFRAWLVTKGGRCTPQGNVLIRDKVVTFAEASKPHAYRINLTEVAQ